MTKAIRWEEISREVVYKKYSQTIERRDYKLPNGQVSDYYIRVQGNGACAFALTKDNEVITIPQYRPGPDAILWELPGGFVDDGEDPLLAAQRELLEETGYAGDAEAWIGTWQVDAYTQTTQSVIIVKNCMKVAEPAMEATEFGEADLLSIADFVARARTGQLTDAAGALLALDHLGLLSNNKLSVN